MSQEIDTLMPHDLINAKPVSRGREGVLRQLAALAVHGPDEPALARSRTSVVSPRSGRAVSRASARASRSATFTPRTTVVSARSRRRKVRTSASSRRSRRYARVNEYGFVETPYRRVERRQASPTRCSWYSRARGRGQVHRPGDGRRSTRRASSRESLVSARLQRRLPDGRARHGPAHGRRAEPDGVGRRGARSVPRARRREPRAHGREHAASGRAAHPHAWRRSSAPAWKASVARDSGVCVVAQARRARRERRRDAHRRARRGRRRPRSRTSTTSPSSSARTSPPATTRSRSSARARR